MHRTGLRAAEAVVIGGGLAGLLTAHVLAPHIGRVVVVEQDRLPEGPEPRRGVPQSTHVHGLGVRGLRTLERLLPGFTRELTGAGAPRLDLAGDLAMRTPHGWAAVFPSGLDFVCASRPLVEWTVRRMVRSADNIVLREETRVTALTGDASSVTGVRVRTPGGTDDGPPLTADLVVDASGRGSPVDAWLAGLGCAPLPKETVDPHIGYASRLYRVPPCHRAPWQACYLQGGPPGPHRGGVLAPIEGGRWIVTLIGSGTDRPSTREEDFLPYARGLADPLIADAIADAEPLTGISGSHATSNRRRLIRPGARLPGNLLLTGDSLCCFNPVYGQGMTAAALGAALLGECLTAGPPALAGLAGPYHHRLAALTGTFWDMAATADNLLPGTDGPAPSRSQRLAARYLGRVQSAGTRDPHVHLAFLEVLHSLRPPSALLAPRIAFRTLTARGPAQGRPQALPQPPVPGPAPDRLR
ncbi:2-polyprenyl-6-methoxyphenol hydroxylase-like oxidoreductase [Streptomyces griseocarneus]|nr:2-polyprenyl-6-methoxyphenol hydroxylase-like oxidoreductase [Streptomyces griseocarneus]